MAAPAEAGLRVTVHLARLAMLAKARCVYWVQSSTVTAIQRACRSIAVRRARSFHRLSPCLGSTVSSPKKVTLDLCFGSHDRRRRSATVVAANGLSIWWRRTLDRASNVGVASLVSLKIGGSNVSHPVPIAA